MNVLYPFAFWLLLFLVPVFIKKDFKDLSVRAILYMVTFIFIVLAISRVVIEQQPIKNKQVLSDVVVAVDLSYSMQATDIQPTRLKKAKEFLKDLVSHEHKSRFGVLGFTTNAIILSPLTTDSELLLHLFSTLNENFLITKGSDIMSALKLARKMSDSKKLSVVIFSDGADEFDYDSEALYAQKNNIRVNVLMIATSMGGTLSLENGELLKDELGDIVVSRENSAIKEICDETDGIYTKSLGTILSALDSQRVKDEESEVVVMKNIELFYYFVFLAILSFLLAVTSLKKYALIFLLLFGVNLNADVKEYFYEILDKNRAEFNQATRYYENGEYEKALGSFKIVKSSDEKFKSVIYYNIANTLIRLQEFKKARENYLKSLTLFYSLEADENLAYIEDVGEKKEMSTGQQKSAKKSSLAKKRQNSKKQKEGGTSNMKVSANASSGANDKKQKNESESMTNLNSAKAKLSSKQYELINKKEVDENKPW